MYDVRSVSLVLRAALLAVVLGTLAPPARAVDESPPAILQWFESSYKTIERRTPDVFLAGYGAVWTPPPGRADLSNFSVGYDVYDRFDLGSAGSPTLYGTETGIKSMASLLHRAGTDLHVDFVVNHNGYSGTGDAASRQAFRNAGGYPGFFLDRAGDADGDFHGAFEGGDIRGRLAYVDRLRPVSSVARFEPWQGGRDQDRDLVVRSVDQTADSVHVLLNLPAAAADEQVLAMVGAGNKASQIDRDPFKYAFFDVKNGNNVATVVTFGQTGTYNVQRIPGLHPATPLGAGLGDLNFNGQYQPDDVAHSAHGFEAVLYSRNQQFNPAADLNADGLVDNRDLYQFQSRLQSAGAGLATIAAAEEVLRRRGDMNQVDGTDAADIDFLFTRRGGAADWLYDLDVDGAITSGDVDTLVRTILRTRPGDANLDGSVNGSDFALLAGNFGRTGRGWSLGNFNGDDSVNGTDFALLAGHFGFPAQLSTLELVGLCERARPERRHSRAGGAGCDCRSPGPADQPPAPSRVTTGRSSPTIPRL